MLKLNVCTDNYFREIGDEFWAVLEFGILILVCCVLSLVIGGKHYLAFWILVVSYGQISV